MKSIFRTVITLLVVVISLAVMSCNACAKCTEPTTGVTDEFCGKKISAETYAKGLRAQGWTCTVD